MIRRVPLRRSARVRARRGEPRRSERVGDRAHMNGVRRLPCCARDLSPCWGRIEADHAGERPLGRKANDDTCIPLCTLHHRERTDFAGPFRDWDRAQMRAWLDAAIAATRARLNPITAGAAGLEAM